MDSDLIRRVAQLEARAEIAELVGSYGIACDDRDIKGLGALFMPDARFASADGVMASLGRDAIVEMFRGRFRQLGPTYHWTHDHAVRFDDADDDLATGHLLGHAECWRNGEPLLAAMRYADTYRRHDGRWRFASRVLSFFYYVSALEYAEALGSTLRMRAYGDRRPADYPESLTTWTNWETEQA